MHSLVTQNGHAIAPSPDVPLVIFALAAQRGAIAVHAVIEIVRLPALTPLRGASPYVCGLLNWHGQYLPVLDGRALVDEPPHCDLASQVILVGPGHAEAAREPRLGLLVDAVHQVRALSATSLTWLPPEAAAPYIAAVFHESDGTSALVFDVGVLLSLAPELGQPFDQERHHGTPHEN